jgi:regulator of cell morphogenesis and NO signaling
MALERARVHVDFKRGPFAGQIRIAQIPGVQGVRVEPEHRPSPPPSVDPVDGQGDVRVAASGGGEQQIADAAIQREIELVKSEPVTRSQNYAAWELSFLADYIVNTHHAYLNENTGQIAAYAHKIAEVHGAHHPEVIEIATIFDKIAADMVGHLREEEEVLFPMVKRVDAARKTGTPPEAKDRAAIKASLEKLGHEHEEIGDAIHAIRHLAKDYAIPDDVCNTFVVTYQKLKEFEDDLHKHVHLENNILFLKAATL